jgi:catechol 2,3-dioxygenase-like lactoylglutathione lyase family enzyme/ribosomal protein S18 acetylase RimI-like enzyme
MTSSPSLPGEPARFTRAEAADADALVALVREYYAFDAIAFDEGSVRRGLADLLADEVLGGAWLVRRGSDAVGFFVVTYGFDMELGGRQATVTELYLRPEHRRGGLGTAAIRYIEEHLRSRGIAAYELQVARENAAARAFYGRMGFGAHDRIPLSKRVDAAGAAPCAIVRERPVLDTVDHVSIGTNDLRASKRFYDAALAPLGFHPHEDIPGEVGYFRSDDTSHREAFALFIGFEDPAAKRPVTPSAGFHIAFRAPSREAVVAFYDAALGAGGRDNGPPGLRPAYHADYFGAFVLDPDGHHVEAVCHEPCR